MILRIDADHIRDSASFHDAFSKALGFPGFYGGNMDAWIDCMSSLRDPEEGLASMHLEPDAVLTLVLESAESFKDRCPELYEDLVECAAIVNWRCVQRGEPALLALAYRA